MEKNIFSSNWITEIAVSSFDNQSFDNDLYVFEGPGGKQEDFKLCTELLFHILVFIFQL